MSKTKGSKHISLLEWSRSRLRPTWQQKGTLILILPLLISLKAELNGLQFLIYFLLASTTLAGILVLGYLSNDLSDKEVDNLSTKPNFWNLFGRSKGLFVLTTAVLATVLPWLFLPSTIYSYLLLLTEGLLLLAYALPPFRLKNYLYLSVVLDALYAYVLPSLLAAYTFYLLTDSKIDLLLILLWSGWTMILGIRHYLNHLCIDRLSDLRSNQSTIATRYGSTKIGRVISLYLLPVEVLLISTSLLRIHTPWQSFLTAGLPLGVALSANLLYNPTRYRFTGTQIDVCYRYYLPLLILGMGSLQDIRYLWVLMLHYLLFYQLNLYHPFLQLLRRWISVGVNYSIYYFRRYVLLRTEQAARLEHYPSYLKAQQNLQRARRLGAIAVVNQHRKKYTETFVWAELEKLRFGVYFLHSGLLPKYEGEGRSLLGQRPWQRTAYSLWAQLQGLSSDYYLERAISHFLLKKKVKALLVHFGPSASRMLDVSKATGLPMIVYFHGYDVYYKKTVENLRQLYSELFNEASAFLCASEEIRQRLLEAGAPTERLYVLPAYVDLNLFSYSDHSHRPPELLFVGRFCNTKSPHLLLLAFADLLKKLPQSRLRLIGGKEGELYEACHILAKALKIEASVCFLESCTHKEIAAEMQKARALVLPSVTTPLSYDKEGTPVAIMEASASGLPVIATKHAGISEQITHEIDGLLVPEYDLEALQEAMFRVCTDNELVRRLGTSASERIRSDTRTSQHTQHLEEHILQAIQRK